MEKETAITIFLNKYVNTLQYKFSERHLMNVDERNIYRQILRCEYKIVSEIGNTSSGIIGQLMFK